MKSILFISVTALTIIVGVLPSGCLVQAQISCYNCTAFTSTDNCAVVSGSTSTLGNCGTCYTAVVNSLGTVPVFICRIPQNCDFFSKIYLYLLCLRKYVLDNKCVLINRCVLV